jgi:hypothetical protein
LGADSVTGWIIATVFAFVSAYVFLHVFIVFIRVMSSSYKSVYVGKPVRNKYNHNDYWDEPLDGTYIILPNGERRLDIQ